jgi:membrane-associated phospholipid phosphatase
MTQTHIAGVHYTHRSNINSAKCKNGLRCLGAAFVGAIALFAAFPYLDIAVSHLFGSQSVGFPLRSNSGWEAVRQFFIWVTNGSIAALFAVWVLPRVRPSMAKGRAALCRVAGFSVLAYLLIPGVLVNGLIKPIWARARPHAITDFGGLLDYTSPFQLSDQCQSACSFVSGETSALFTCATLATLFLVPRLSAKWRALTLWSLWGMAVFGSLLRIAVGAHFLSDVVFSAILSSAVVLALALRLAAVPQDAGAKFAKVTAL